MCCNFNIEAFLVLQNTSIGFVRWFAYHIQLRWKFSSDVRRKYYSWCFNQSWLAWCCVLLVPNCSVVSFWSGSSLRELNFFWMILDIELWMKCLSIYGRPYGVYVWTLCSACLVWECLWAILYLLSIIHYRSLLKLMSRANDWQLPLYDRGDCNSRRVGSGSSVLQAGQLQPEPDVHADSRWVPSSNGGTYGWDGRLARQINCFRHNQLGNRRLLANTEVKLLVTRIYSWWLSIFCVAAARIRNSRITSLEINAILRNSMSNTWLVTECV